jgi:hypothetical protein
MKNKKTAIVMVLFIAFCVVNGVYAEDATPSGENVKQENPSKPNTGGSHSDSVNSSTSAKQFFNIDDINKLFKDASNAATRKQDQLTNIIKGADLMISNRITTLNALITRIQGDKRLSDSEKASLTSDIQASIDGLNSLKATIDADTDATKARTDAKQIVSNFKVYEIFEPKIRLLVTLNNLQTTSTNVAGLVPQVQNLINNLGSTGKDVSQLNSLLIDISSQLTTINTTITTDLAAVQGVTTTTTDPKSVFTKVNQDLAQIVRTDFAKIRSDFAQMREDFHQLFTGSIKNTTVSTPEPTATP